MFYNGAYCPKRFFRTANELNESLVRNYQIKHGAIIEELESMKKKNAPENKIVKLTKKIKQGAINLLGKEQVEDLDIRLSAEDFAVFSQHIPACFFRLGVRNEEEGITFAVHHPRFDADKEAVRYGALALSNFAYQLLKK